MNTTLSALDLSAQCQRAIQRLNVDSAPETLADIDAFIDSCQEHIHSLTAIDRIALQNAAVEYCVAWLTADQLETVVGQAGLTATKHGKDGLVQTVRVNPASSQAAAARVRMRQILKYIRALLESAPEPSRAEALQINLRAPRATQSSSSPTEPACSGVEISPIHAEAQILPDTSLILPPATAITPEVPTLNDVHQESGPEQRLAGDDSTGQQTPEPDSPLVPAVAPPMNRAQRRALAREQSRADRKANRRLQNRQGR